jgi:hypothetical protein
VTGGAYDRAETRARGGATRAWLRPKWLNLRGYRAYPIWDGQNPRKRAAALTPFYSTEYIEFIAFS